jgi:carbonic anhydrase/acetyltransferase-like protein (isoleucine patch superfamily)
MSNRFDVDFFAMIFWQIWIIKNKIRIILQKIFIHFYCYARGVKIGERIRFNGFPVIYRYRKSRIVIGHNCSFNSAKDSVLLGPIKPCTLITLNPDANINIGNYVGITGSIIVAAKNIEIGNNVIIGLNCSIYDTDFHDADPAKRLITSSFPSRPVMIKDNVFIGANCIILKGVTIGQNSSIGAGSVVVNDIPDNSIAIGNPCKVVIRKKT